MSSYGLKIYFRIQIRIEAGLFWRVFRCRTDPGSGSSPIWEPAGDQPKAIDELSEALLTGRIG